MPFDIGKCIYATKSNQRENYTINVYLAVVGYSALLQPLRVRSSEKKNYDQRSCPLNFDLFMYFCCGFSHDRVHNILT